METSLILTITRLKSFTSHGGVFAVSVDVLKDHYSLSTRQTFVSSDKSVFISLPHVY